MAAEGVVASVAAATIAYVLRRRHAARLAPPAQQARRRREIDDAGGYIGLDIGGSLAKLVYFEPDESSSSSNK